MDTPTSSSFRPRSFDLLPKPESGLAEWTSKIKALQRQVDEDDETEQRQLQEEITASRIARQRRSVMYSNPRGSISNTDLGRVESPLRASFARHETLPEDIKGIADRQKHQEDALRKLMDSTPSLSSRSPSDKPILPISPPDTMSVRPAPPRTYSQPKAEPISLAQFMGGRGTGPRLKKHTAQQDAHDPTQFEQRTVQDIKAPHPIFGRGGVAMPGLADKGRVPPPSASAYSVQDNGHKEDSGSRSPVGQADRRVSTPPIARRYVEKLEDQKTGNGRDRVRERTFSTPSASPFKRTSVPHVQPDPHSQDATAYSGGPVSRSPIPEMRPRTPPNGRHMSTSTTKSPPSPPDSTSTRPFTPRTQHVASSPATTSPSTSPSASASNRTFITTPSLARPVHSSPKPSVYGPQIPPSRNLSPAFLRSPPQKDPTPSLSRLQGRGFVQNMVKASSQLSQAANGSSDSAPAVAEKGKIAGGKRLSSVLDRWPAASSSSSGPSSPPLPPPKPIPLRKSQTVDPTVTMSNAEASFQQVKPMQTGRSIKSVPSLPNMRQVHTTTSPVSIRESDPAFAGKEASSSQASGLGSSNTLISYIKPNKTGDAPPLPTPTSAYVRHTTVPSQEVDELGTRMTDRRVGEHGASGGSSGLPAPSGQPLSHPTKGRAKPRRKDKDGKPSKFESSISYAIPEESDAEARISVRPTVQLPASPVVVERLSTPSAVRPRSRTPPSARTVSPFDESTGSTPAAAAESKVGRVADRWTSQNLIGVKPIAPARVSPEPSTFGVRGVGERHALPGLTAVVPSPVLPPPKEEKSPSTPVFQKHARIPSTGNRATVMDVAQVLNEHHIRESTMSPVSPSPSPDGNLTEPEPLSELDMKPRLGPRMPQNLFAPSQSDRRKTSYEKYSAIVMPPLNEERTPVPSPAGTLSRRTDPVYSDTESSPTLVMEELKDVKRISGFKAHGIEEPLMREIRIPEPTSSSEVIFKHVDDPLPAVDIDALLNAKLPFEPNASDSTVSVDVLTILGTSATAVQRETYAFYDTEVLAVIHRSKSKASGLVNTKVWGWFGKKCQPGEKEERKLSELAKRYGTALERVQQYAEPAELVHVLGGQLAIRQGTRAHWSSENTCMHLIRMRNGYISIDELDINVKNLCSGYSYCLSMLGTFYVWHGCGSLPRERQAALEYAERISGNLANIVELVEGDNDDDEMFWMILGDQEYAKADYWKWRASAAYVDARVWRTDAENGKEPVHFISSFTEEKALEASVYIIDCIWELFVLVGRDARAKRKDIRLALSIAVEMSNRSAALKPFNPTVHVVVLPSQLPLDLQLSFRDLNEIEVNDGEVPDHMNILTTTQAYDQLRKTAWERTALQDHTLLPLGIHPSML